MGDGRTRNWVVGLLAVLGAGFAAPGAAQAWDRPLPIGFGIGANPRVDDHGTTRWQGHDRRSLLIASVRSGSRRIHRCHLPKFEPNGLLGYRWATNAAGAMAFSWDPDSKHKRVKLVSARPGHCFGRPIALGARKARSSQGSILLSPLGTLLAIWTETAHGKSRPVLATGPLGRKPVRRHYPGPPRRGFDRRGGSPTFIGGDRIAWTWFTLKVLEPDARYLEQFWGAIGSRTARGFGRALKLASLVSGPDQPHSMQGARVLTDRRGGQVLGWLDNGSFFLRARRSGKPFGRTHSWFAHGAISLQSASNRAGDAAFAWDYDGEVYALVRRRNGRVTGPQLVSTGDPPVAQYPSIAIDGAGRAIVTFTAQFAQPSQIGIDEVQVVTSGRDGRFGAPVRVSGPKRGLFGLPLVGANAHGRTALIYERDTRDESGNLVRTEVFLIRGRLGR